MEFNDILKLAKTVAKANPSAPTAYSFEGQSYSYEDMNEALRVEFSALEIAPLAVIAIKMGLGK